MTGGGDILTKFGGLASGLSLATFMVLPPTASTAAAPEGAPLPAPSAIVAPSPYVGSSQTGFGTSRLVLPLERQAQPAIAVENTRRASNGPEPNLARKLKEVSGLGVAPLARIVGVSRPRFYLWLKEGGIGREKISHVMSLIAMFRDLRPIVGSDMRGFVRSQSPAGSIEQLLNRGETKAVMGLALHPAVKQQRVWQGENPARQISELPGWIRPSRRLAWEPSPVDNVTRQQTLDEFGASSAEMDVYLPGAESDDDTFPDAVHVVYES